MAESFRHLRESKGRSQTEVAKAVAISPAPLARLEAEQRWLYVKDFVSIAEALGEKPGNLLPNDVGAMGHVKPLVDRLAAATSAGPAGRGDSRESGGARPEVGHPAIGWRVGTEITAHIAAERPAMITAISPIGSAVIGVITAWLAGRTRVLASFALPSTTFFTVRAGA